MQNTIPEDDISSFIIDNVGSHPSDITKVTAEMFGISRQATLKRIHTLVDKGFLTATGKTRDRKYHLRSLASLKVEIDITPDLQEDQVWFKRVQPLLEIVKPNVLWICNYGFTEILNNAIEHSEGRNITIMVWFTAANILFGIVDDGVGIFSKIQREFNLEDKRQAILELSKGKLTTAPAHHTGEGIFFTSRMFDAFVIVSDELRFGHIEKISKSDLLIEELEYVKGTTVIMQINTRSKVDAKDVFDRFADTEYGFTKTHLFVGLVRYGDENLISRSQARRLLARVDRFEEVTLDFKDVEIIGQAFADEIFRVFRLQHPEVRLLFKNAVPQVENMIKRAIAHK